MRAYVTIRGSRSPRRVDRDASQIMVSTSRTTAGYPYAALVFPEGERGSRYELFYSLRPALVEGDVAGFVPVVELVLLRAGQDPVTLWSGEVFP